MEDGFGFAEGFRSYHSGTAGRVLGDEAASSVAVVLRDHGTYFAGPGVTDDGPSGDNALVHLVTGKYRPPRRVSIRCSPEWADIDGHYEDGTWTFEVGGEQHRNGFEFKAVLDGTMWMVGRNWQVPGFGRRAHLSDETVRFAYNVSLATQMWAPNHLVTLRSEVEGWGTDVFGTYEGGKWWFTLDAAVYPAAFRAKFVVDRRWFMEGPDLHIAADVDDHHSLDESEVSFDLTPSAFRHDIDRFSTVGSTMGRLVPVARGTEAELYDVIVIGSGMGGGVLADALSDRSVRTLVLEAGNVAFPMHMSNVTGHWDGMAQRDQLGTFTNGKDAAGTPSLFLGGPHFNLGGRSVYWSGIIPRMRRWEFGAVWPESVRSYLLDQDGYDRAETELWKTAPTEFEEQLCDHLTGALGPDFSATALPRSLHAPGKVSESGRPLGPAKARGVFSTADTLLDSTGFPGAAGSSYLAINLDHLVVGLEADGDRVTKVVCEDLLGRVRRSYRGKVVVLAGGSLESPRVALNSGVRDPNGRIGVGLTDHPAWFSLVHPELPTEGDLGWLGDRGGHGKALIQQGTGETPDHPFNVELLVNPMYWDFRHADPDIARRRAEERGPSKLEVKFIFDSPLDDGNWVRSPGVGRKLDVFVRPNQTATPFIDEVADLRSVLFSALGVRVPAREEGWRLGNEGTVHHAGGTLRMSDDHTGVVDEWLRFEGYRNLYACDVSVFPSVPVANPALTLVALALRLAEHLVEEVLR